jgi:hypothetical protein
VNEENMTLPTNSVSFQAENARSWLVRFWELPGKWVGIAFPFGFVLWILFYFDHNVSVRSPSRKKFKEGQDGKLMVQSLIAQGSEFPLRKPPGFHWDFFLLGFVIFASGILGLPASNGTRPHLYSMKITKQTGLIPQAPLHTSSLTVMGWEDEKDSTITEPERDTRELPASYPRTEAGYDLEMRNLGSDDQMQRTRSSVDGLRRRLSRDPQVRMEREKEEEKMRNRREIPVAVVEQRLSNLAQGCLCT